MGDFTDRIDLIAERVVQKQREQSGNIWLGKNRIDWARILLGWSVAALIAVGTWWLWVRDSIADRPTRQQVEDTVSRGRDMHEDSYMAHPRFGEVLTRHGAEIRALQESQIRQVQIDKQQTELLREIRQDVKALRKRGR